MHNSLFKKHRSIEVHSIPFFVPLPFSHSHSSPLSFSLFLSLPDSFFLPLFHFSLDGCATLLLNTHRNSDLYDMERAIIINHEMHLKFNNEQFLGRKLTLCSFRWVHLQSRLFVGGENLIWRTHMGHLWGMLLYILLFFLFSFICEVLLLLRHWPDECKKPTPNAFAMRPLKY